MYAYRDWVIRAFNQNKPFDEFTVEQIAGDLLKDPTLDQLIATGFQRNNITTNEGGVVPEEYEAIYAKDRVETIGDVYLGLTVGCATCHDHKFDPISQREFYAMTAFFTNTTQYVMDGNVSDPPPILVVPRDQDRDDWYDLRKEATDIETALVARQSAVDTVLEEWLEEGAYRELLTPLETSAEILSLALEDSEGPSVILEGELRPITIQPGTTLERGPRGHPALMFEAGAWDRAATARARYLDTLLDRTVALHAGRRGLLHRRRPVRPRRWPARLVAHDRVASAVVSHHRRQHHLDQADQHQAVGDRPVDAHRRHP